MSKLKTETQLPQTIVSSSIFGGLDKYFEDLEKYEDSLYCSECGEDNNKIFYFRRTTSNSEVWWCENCKREEVTSKSPKEDNY
jgi:hypothetical protein